jgi:fatty acid desaturase
MNRWASGPANSATGRIEACSADTSPKPLTQRAGRSTFRSVTLLASVTAVTSSSPTLSRIWLAVATAPARAARIGGLKSTLVVPDVTGSVERADGGRSSRA